MRVKWCYITSFRILPKLCTQMVHNNGQPQFPHGTLLDFLTSYMIWFLLLFQETLDKNKPVNKSSKKPPSDFATGTHADWFTTLAQTHILRPVISIIQWMLAEKSEMRFSVCRSRIPYTPFLPAASHSPHNSNLKPLQKLWKGPLSISGDWNKLQKFLRPSPVMDNPHESLPLKPSRLGFRISWNKDPFLSTEMNRTPFSVVLNATP